MAIFSKGDTVSLVGGGVATIEDDEPLGSGAQGEVYRVSFNGKEYALKWYISEKIKNNEDFRSNLQRTIDRGTDCGSFLWPLYLTAPDSKREGFGYIMNLIPPEYEPLSNILRTYRVNNKTGKQIAVQFKDLDAMFTAALNIIAAFKKLHYTGCSYQDLNDGGFFFDLKTGDALVCDCDNVAPFGYNFGIGGKPGYMAPEVVTRNQRPNANTDRFSLAVVLFRLLVRGDPLEGANVIRNVTLTGAAELECYGNNPIFVYDPNDASNRPVRGVHDNVIRFWPFYPDYIQKAFIKSFTVGLHDPSERVTDQEWFDLLVRLRGELVRCSCDNKQRCLSTSNASDDPDYYVCSNCHRQYNLLKIADCRFVIAENTVLYENETRPRSEDFRRVSGKITENRNHPGIFGISNNSDRDWKVTYESGTEKEFGPDKTAAIERKAKIEFGSYENGKKIVGVIL